MLRDKAEERHNEMESTIEMLRQELQNEVNMFLCFSEILNKVSECICFPTLKQ